MKLYAVQVQNQSEILCLDPCSVQTRAHFSSTQFISVRFCAFHSNHGNGSPLQKGGISQSFPMFNVCFCTFNR